MKRIIEIVRIIFLFTFPFVFGFLIGDHRGEQQGEQIGICKAGKVVVQAFRAHDVQFDSSDVDKTCDPLLLKQKKWDDWWNAPLIDLSTIKDNK